MHRSLLSVVLFLSVLFSSLVTAQDASYTYTPIKVPGATHTFAFGINDEGQIVGRFGSATSGNHGFLKDGTTFITIDAPGGTYFTEPRGINAAGQIVGVFGGEAGQHGFLKDGTTFTTIDVPRALFTDPYGINDDGQIVGWFRDDARVDHGFLIDGATLTTFDVPGAVFTRAHGINNHGQISGWFRDVTGREHGFLKDGDTFTVFDVPGAQTPETFGINDEGQIVGRFDGATGSQGFLVDSATFTTIEVPGDTQTHAFGINNRGLIIGFFSDATGTHGFVATLVDETPPVITIAASPKTLLPANGKLVAVTVSGTILDEPEGSVVESAAYTVVDEYGQIQPSGSVTLGPGGSYAFTIQLQASRDGHDRDGRLYTIEVSATDDAGNLGTASATVTVPRKRMPRTR
jgi:probable HAF family extracellular repeat protein